MVCKKGYPVSSYSWWDIANKLANFALLMATLWHLNKKYIYPYIVETFKKRKQYFTDHELRQNELSIAHAAVIQDIEHQQRETKLLLVKIDVWQKNLQQSRKKNAEQRVLIEQQSIEYLKKRADGLCEEQLRQEVVPIVLQLVHERLMNQFAAPVQQKNYIDRSLAYFIKKGAHE